MAASSGAVSASYVYDGNLKRAKQDIDGQVIYSVYGASGALIHRLEGTESTDYIRASGMAVARVKETGTGTEVSSVHTDHLGSPVAATGASSTLLWRDNRTPFGEPWGPQDPANDNSPGFTGHIEDTATGLTYMQARYYNPVWARFLSNDPVSFSPEQPYMFGRYTYAANDPVNYWDPDGELVVGIGLAVLIELAIQTGPQMAICGTKVSCYRVDGQQLVIAGLAGGLTGGLGRLVGTGVSSARKAHTANKIETILDNQPFGQSNLFRNMGGVERTLDAEGNVSELIGAAAGALIVQQPDIKQRARNIARQLVQGSVNLPSTNLPGSTGPNGPEGDGLPAGSRGGSGSGTGGTGGDGTGPKKWPVCVTLRNGESNC